MRLRTAAFLPGRLSGAFLALLPLAAGRGTASEVDLRDAVRSGQVTIEARGNGNTDNLTLTLSTGLPSIDLLVPAGMYFARECPPPPGEGPQPMVVTRTAHVHLVGRMTVTVDANCADLSAHVPGPQDAFLICETPPALEEVVTCLASHPEIASHEQFVIWALTNDICDFSPLHPSAADLDAIRQALRSCGIRPDGWCLFDTSLFVPVVLSSAGANQSFFTTELTLTNRGGADATLTFTYVPAFGGGGGQGMDVLRAGRQRVVADGIAYLRSLGVPLPDSGNRGGTVRVSVAGAAPGEVDLTARTTTAVASGRAGLAYSGMPHADRLDGTSYLCGLRQNGQDRSNVALQNAGDPSDGDVTLRLTVFSGDAGAPPAAVLPDVTLAPGGFQQVSGILASGGLSLANGFVRVERVGGGARYVAYAVINDQFNSDGSYVPAAPFSGVLPGMHLALPVLVETSTFSTELVATNFSPAPKTLHLTFVADAIQTPDQAAPFTLSLGPGEQRILPDFVALMRQSGTPGIGPPGPTYAGALFVEEAGGDLSGVVVGARVSSPGGGGRFGLFFTAQAVERQTASTLWLYGLQQNAENRTNLALVNLGQPGDDPDVFDVELYDGATGAKAATLPGVSLEPRAWKQYGAVLSTNAPGVTQGYARVVRTSGTSPFLVYGVLNDGGTPGQRTGDGAFVWGIP
jgi:hypothetical protein